MNAICKSERCSGCGACVNACSKNAIIMHKDEKGFLYPIINESVCVDCGRCKAICPQNNTPAVYPEGKIYAALATDDSIRARSSSGGIFYLIAEQILNEGGVVCGAAFVGSSEVHHIIVSKKEDLQLLQGSKYVQSGIGSIYSEIRNLLDNNITVLFSGTPCQVDALKKLLGKKYSNLLTIDILCHGVPSPAAFVRYVEYVERKNNNTIDKIFFRAKDPGWEHFGIKISFSNGLSIIENSFLNFFLQNFLLRPACHNCMYSMSTRCGDITLGDYWKYKETAPDYIENDDLGISFVSVNSSVGEIYFNKIKKKVVRTEKSIEDAVNGNPILHNPSVPNEKYEEFWHDFPVLSWEELMLKYDIHSEKRKDWYPKDARDYFAQPFLKRYKKHYMKCKIKSLIK